MRTSITPSLPPARVHSSRLPEALASCRWAFLGIALFSCLINVLGLNGSLYMLQLYDRVLPSRSVPTLVGLTVLMVGLYAAFGILDLFRTRVMSRVGRRLDRRLRERVFAAVLLLPLHSKEGHNGLQPVRDLDQIRAFLSGPGPIALFDLPWMPIYLALVFLLHPLLGLAAAIGAAVLIILTILTERLSRGPMRAAAASATERQVFGEAARRNSEAVRALGMGEHLARLWEAHNERLIRQQVDASDVAGSLGTLSKVLRMVLQSGMLGLGAYLAIHDQATAGVMIAASILTSRALAPVEIAIANWRGFLSARQSCAHLEEVLCNLPKDSEVLSLPPPKRALSVATLRVAAPGSTKSILDNVSFALGAGAGLGIIGPSASGKSTLARALTGAWLSQSGSIRLDEAALDRWRPTELGRHIGYLPQDIELFDGTIAQNIARFDPKARSEAILAAAHGAGVHELVMHLSDGYETRIGEGGAFLSAGQRQRVALARALYGDPFLVVLDEPNSNLDAEGDLALTRAIASVRKRGGIVIVIAHRPAALAGLDQLLILAKGQVQAFGPRDEVLKKMQAPVMARARAPSALRVIADAAR
jgi:ATP-binding cassette, subfamily C, type I secretion system permease/ATPase